MPPILPLEEKEDIEEPGAPLSKAIQLILQEAGRGGGKEAFGLLPSLLSFANGREKSVSIPTIGHLPEQTDAFLESN